MNGRKHLTANEVYKLISAARGVRHEARHHCLLLLMFGHGLRVSEACSLLLRHVDIESRVLHVTRLKEGLSTMHPLRPNEIRAVKARRGDACAMQGRSHNDRFARSCRVKRHTAGEQKSQ